MTILYGYDDGPIYGTSADMCMYLYSATNCYMKPGKIWMRKLCIVLVYNYLLLLEMNSLRLQIQPTPVPRPRRSLEATQNAGMLYNWNSQYILDF